VTCLAQIVPTRPKLNCCSQQEPIRRTNLISMGAACWHRHIGIPPWPCWHNIGWKTPILETHVRGLVSGRKKTRLKKRAYLAAPLPALPGRSAAFPACKAGRTSSVFEQRAQTESSGAVYHCCRRRATRVASLLFEGKVAAGRKQHGQPHPALQACAPHA
jgi:hypothetical protein